MKAKLRAKQMEEHLAKARLKKKRKMTPDSQKTLREKLEEIADDLKLGDPSTVTKINGVTLELYPISALASSIGRTSNTMRLWEAEKVIPKATFRSKNNNRLYAPLQIALVVYLVDKYNIVQGKKIDPNFIIELHKYWEAVKKRILTPPKKGK